MSSISIARLAVLLALLPLLAWADGGVDLVPDLVPEPEIPISQPPDLAAVELDLGWSIFRTLLVLVLVVGLAWLTLNVGLRKLMGISPVQGARVVKVLERVTLDQKRALFVVEAAGEVLLIGGGEGSLSLISKLDRAAVQAQPAPGVQLSPFLSKLLNRNSSPTPPPPAEESGK